MIGYLRGELIQIDDEACLIDVNGVGYYVYCSKSVLNKLGEIVDEEAPVVKLYTQLIHREDTMDLYGFIQKDELRLFTLLLSVSGIGPKQSVKILGVRNPGDIIKAIVSGDSDFLMSLSGIGKKKAQQIILELKEKVKKSFDIAASPVSSNYNEAVKALESLGFTSAESRDAVEKVLSDETFALNGGKTDVTKIVENALKQLS
jgi:Holliday junction DNA helicase RuvA